jgi:acyl-CoA synthetase (NDP forming)
MREKSSDVSFFFNPKSIAIVGASPNHGKLSYVILESLKRIGFPGVIYPVNPKYTSISDLRCYSSVMEIGEGIDLAVIAVPAPLVLSALIDAGRKIKGAIIVSAGFKEAGEEGRRLEEGIKDLSQREGIRIMGPNCMGLYDTISKVDTFFIPAERIGRPGRGGVSILSQSGSFAATIMDEMASEGIGVARVVSYGNRVDVGESDYLGFLADDKDTRVVALYMESVDDGRRFIEAASRCARKKPVIAVKVGKREAGVSAARSHTGAMAGRYEIYRAAFRKAGIIEVAGYEGLKDACKVLNIWGQVKGKRVLIISDGGGIGVGIADACEEMGLEVPPLKEAARKRLSKRFPNFYSFGNPIDLTGSATDDDYVTALKDGLKDGFDIAIVALLWGPPQLTDGLVGRLSEAIRDSDKPVIICSPGGRFTCNMNRAFGERGIPVLTTPESAARAAAVLAKR